MSDNAGSVPVFNCIVYVSSGEGGGVRARVANLDGLECTAANEREALAGIVAAFKQRVAQLIKVQTPIPWIETPARPQSHERERLIPVHL